VQEWETVYKETMAIKKWIDGMEVKYYHIQSEKIDLKITPGKQRKWVGLSGHNIPSLEIFLSPDWGGLKRSISQISPLSGAGITWGCMTGICKGCSNQNRGQKRGRFCY